MTGYDNIIVGGGNSGCVVAARLTEDSDRQVLLLEAGGSDRRLDILMPAAFIQQFGKTAIDWDFWTEPEPTLADRRIRSPRGKVLGGCSSMNAMAYIRGNRLDYDGWAEQGASGRSYEEVLPYFRRSEDNQEFNDHYHARGGPLTVSRSRHTDPVTAGLLDGALSLGLEHNPDFNGADQEGFGPLQLTQRAGVRLDAARAFLRKAMRRPNLTVHTKAHVTRIVPKAGRAVAVEYLLDGHPRRAEVTGDVVLSTGAFGTPALLQHSGIGPAAHLSSVGITPLVDLPAIGAHLMEHPLISIPYEFNPGNFGMFDAEHPRYLAQWLVRRNGKLSSNVVEAAGHWRSSTSGPHPTSRSSSPQGTSSITAPRAGPPRPSRSPSPTSPPAAAAASWSPTATRSTSPRSATTCSPRTARSTRCSKQSHSPSRSPPPNLSARFAAPQPAHSAQAPTGTCCAPPSGRPASTPTTRRAPPASVRPTTAPSTRNCACTASTACASPTCPSCRPSPTATPWRPPT